MVTEKKDEQPVALLTTPMSLETDSENQGSSNYRAPNLIQRILSLLSNVGTGSDLTRLQLPPLFNIPKSQLQCYGESVYCINNDMLKKCVEGESSIERFKAVVAWSISTVRPLMFGVAPYNPILGETHHVSNGTINVLLEQVSHHPPVSALHASDVKGNIDIVWCQSPVPKFLGTHIDTEVQGTRKLKIISKNETYIMNSPKLVIRLLPLPGVHWLGNVTIVCQETGIRAELCYRGNSILPLPSIHRSVKGKIFTSTSSTAMYDITGHWDRNVIIKDLTSGKKSVLYSAMEAISGLRTPIVVDPKGLSPTESAVVWRDANQAILESQWDKAKEAKSCVEERQREVTRRSNLGGEKWVPRHFTLSYSKEKGWDCSPNQKFVSPAPIVVPL